MTGYVIAVLSSMVLLTVDLTAQQPRDNQRRALTGTAMITGVVLSAESPSRPLRRVFVRISGTELEMSRSTITTDDGRFTFDSLPSGRYTVMASKDGYVSFASGAVRAGRPGRPVVLAAGENRQMSMQLPRGAVITGMLRDPQGDPLPGLRVVVLSMRFAAATGEQRLTVVPDREAVTDDRGVYRLFGLEAGSYLVSALPRFPNAGVASEVIPMSRDEVQRALSELQEQRASPRPGMPARSTRAPAPGAAARGIGVSFAPTYYPGTTTEARAKAVDLATGEVRTGVDFDLDYVPLASVDGFVSIPSGARVQLTLFTANPDTPYRTTTAATVGQDGRFRFRRVAPGHYVIAARAFSTPASVTPGSAPNLWGKTEVVVAGDDIEGVGLVLEPGMTLAGELVFEGTTVPPALNGFRLPLQVMARGSVSVPFPTPVVEGSQIVLRGVVPGHYLFLASPQGIRTRVGPWWLKSIVMDDREVLDRPLEILPNTNTLRVTFSDRASQLFGVVTDRDGTPVADSYVVVFSEDARTWFHHSRRVAAVQLNNEGRYAVSNLPAGSYFLAVSSDLENNEWFDPARLSELRATASRVTVTENQVVSRNITVGGRQK